MIVGGPLKSPESPDLWNLALDHPHIAPAELAAAIERQADEQPLDFRTRLLIRDSVDALHRARGDERTSTWLSQSPNGPLIEEIRRAPLGPPGFASLTHRIMEPTRTDAVLQFLRELGQRLTEPTSISIGGSIALILADLLSRRTEVVDIVDDFPVQIRFQHDLLNELGRRYSLRLAHFQSHYLPTSWESRLHSVDTFDKLQVLLVAPTDIFLSKLFSNREKDRDDLRILAARLDRSVLTAQLPNAAALRAEDHLRKNAEQNWYILYGQPLPA